jgi:hypothetical protein
MVSQLLELKNETWLDEDEVELSIDEFTVIQFKRVSMSD